MLQRFRSKLDKWFPGTYDGLRAGFAPVDWALAKAAKRSYALYRLWDRYQAWTAPLFEKREPDGDFDPRWLDGLRRDGYSLVADAFEPREVSYMREFVLDRHEAALAHVRKQDPAGTQDFFNWKSDE